MLIMLDPWGLGRLFLPFLTFLIIVAQTVLPCFTAHVPEMGITVKSGSEIDTGGERRLIFPTGL